MEYKEVEETAIDDLNDSYSRNIEEAVKRWRLNPLFD